MKIVFRYLNVGVVALALLGALIIPTMGSARQAQPTNHSSELHNFQLTGLGSFACALAPDPVTQALCNSPVLRKLLGDAAHSAASSAESSVATSVAEGFINAWISPFRDWGQVMMSGVIASITGLPDPNVQADNTFSAYENFLGLELALLSGFFLIGLLIAMFPPSPRKLASLLRSTLNAVIFGVLTPGLIALGIVLANELSSSAAGDPSTFGSTLSALFVISAGPVLGTLLYTVIMAAVAAVLFFEEALRTTGIPILTITIPLGLLGNFIGLWGTNVLKKICFFICGLVLAKPLSIIVITVGSSLIAPVDLTNPALNLGSLMVGTVIMILAAYLPFKLMTSIPQIAARVQNAIAMRNEPQGAGASGMSPEVDARSTVQRLAARIPGANSSLLPLAAGALGGPAAAMAVATAQGHVRNLQTGSRLQIGAPPARVEQTVVVNQQTGEVERFNKVIKQTTNRQAERMYRELTEVAA